MRGATFTAGSAFSAGGRRSRPRASSRHSSEAPEHLTRSAVVGCLFVDLRKALHLSLPEVAARVGTRVDVVDALERGDVRILPPWPETERVVIAYTGLAGIDAKPVLTVLRREFEDEAHTLDLVANPNTNADDLRGVKAFVHRHLTSMSARLDDGSVAARLGRALSASVGHVMQSRRRMIGTLVLVSLALMVSFGDFGALRSAATHLPAPLASMARSLDDTLLRLGAADHEGLVWIDVDDPRSRKGDKLQTGRR